MVLGSCFFPDGLPLAVATDSDGTPRTLRFDGRRHAVTHVLRRWRVDERWWRARVWRDYWYIATDSGLLLLVFRELPAGGWRVQRRID